MLPSRFRQHEEHGHEQAFSEHLASVFQPHPSQNDPEEHLILELESPHQLEHPPRRFKRSEAQAVINNFKAKRSPGYDLITGKILQELPPTAVKYLTQFFNAAMIIEYFPLQWKVATIILLLKPSNSPPRTHILPADKPPAYSLQSF
jgi:hypothetical protein